jgi:PadR family transcriptional regulator AphA
LSLTDWTVLALVGERPTHGFDLAKRLAPGSELGQIWTVRRPQVYRALEYLASGGMVVEHRKEAGSAGPPRTIYGCTQRGRRALRVWLSTPVEHVREVRSELLMKLSLARASDPRALGMLVDRQRAALAPVLAVLGSEGSADVVGCWRRHSAQAVMGFLDEIFSLPKPEHRV